MMQRRHVTIALLILSLPSCGIYFEQDFYERISGMKFPKEIQVIETFDNGEFFTTTSFRVDSPHLRDFMTKYGFDRRDKIYPSQFLGNNALKKAQPDFTNLQDLYFKTGSKGKNSWFYVVDLKRQILWAEIQYPDWAGD